jgi:tetratricopeptide (TPR) repeat protein
MYPPLAVHRTILIVDVEGFGNHSRTNSHQVTVRDGLYQALQTAFRRAEIPWTSCDREDRGDSVFILAPPDLPKSLFVESLPRALVEALDAHNATHLTEERIRLRMVLHAGEITYDDHGVTAASINLAFRLLDAEQLKAALAGSPGVLALITSSWFFDEVVQHSRADPLTFRQVPVVVKETATTGWISLPDHPYPPSKIRKPLVGGTISSVPHQLPAYTRHFVGRNDQLNQLTEILEAGNQTTVVITAIDGTAGVGKTTLALHWAHQVTARFPDGQLYVNLRGFDRTDAPMQPGEAIRGFLDALDVPVGRVPLSLHAQTALYRSLLAERRMLVVLDNARDTEQIRPLLPATSTCLVVVTSRNRLAGLITQEGASTVTLDLMTADESMTLLAQHLGHDRVTADPDTAAELVGRCERLPLALTIVAARANVHAHFPLRHLVDDLTQEDHRLSALDTGEPGTDLRAVFSWSYHALTPAAARLFRLLGLHPGPDIGLLAAASLAAVHPSVVRSLFAELTRTHMITEHIPGRFRFHDLLRVYAAERAYEDDTEDERRTAVRRVLDHYLHTGYAAQRQFAPYRRPIAITSPLYGVTLDQITDHRHATDWFISEHTNLLAAIDHAAHNGFDEHAWQVPWTFSEFLQRSGRLHDRITAERTALAAARRLDDRAAQACAHRSLGQAYAQLEQHDEAYAQFQRSLTAYQDVGDRIGEASVHRYLGTCYAWLRRPADGLDHAQRALNIARANRNDFGEARALDILGRLHAMLGDYRLTTIYSGQSLRICHRIGTRYGQTMALLNLGYAYSGLGDHTQAINYYDRALALNHGQGNYLATATVHNQLGDAHLAAGDRPTARDNWRQALTIFEQLGHPATTEIRRKLANVGEQTDPVSQR